MNDSQFLMHLYEKLIQSTSSDNPLLNIRQYSSLINNNPSAVKTIASIRYSKEYLQLLSSQKLFMGTFESLAYLYNRQKGQNHGKKNFSSQFHEWMFEHLFSQEEKSMVEKMIAEEFSGKDLKSKRINEMIGKRENEKEGDFQSIKEKNMFCELLGLVFCEDDYAKKRTQPQKKQENDKSKDSEEFSIGKMLNLMM